MCDVYNTGFDVKLCKTNKPTPERIKDTMPEVLDKLNIQTCQTHTWQTVDSLRTSESSYSNKSERTVSNDNYQEGGHSTRGGESTADSDVGKGNLRSKCRSILPDQDVWTKTHAKTYDKSVMDFSGSSRSSDKLYQDAGIKTIGCEPIEVITQKYIEATDRLMCFMSQGCQDTSVDISAINSVTVAMQDEAQFLCPAGLDLTQSINIDTQLKTSFSSQQLSEISSVLKNFTSEAFDAMKKSETGFMTTVEGQRSIHNAVKDINDNLDLDKVSQRIQKTLAELFTANQIEIKLKDSSIIRGEKCNINQSILIKLIVESMFEDVLNESFNLQGVREFYYENKKFEETNKKGYNLVDRGSPEWISAVQNGFLDSKSEITPELMKQVLPLNAEQFGIYNSTGWVQGPAGVTANAEASAITEEKTQSSFGLIPGLGGGAMTMVIIIIIIIVVIIWLLSSIFKGGKKSEPPPEYQYRYHF